MHEYQENSHLDFYWPYRSLNQNESSMKGCTKKEIFRMASKTTYWIIYKEDGRLLNSKDFSVFVEYVNIERHSIVYEIGYQNQETLIFYRFRTRECFRACMGALQFNGPGNDVRLTRPFGLHIWLHIFLNCENKELKVDDLQAALD